MAGIGLAVTRRLPTGFRSALSRLLRKTIGELNYMVFLARLGLLNDFSGYEKLINYIEANKIGELRGDFLEIGAFTGGGSAKLAKCASRYGKKLIVIDLFDPGFDHTRTAQGQSLNSAYQRLLGRKSQRAVFDRNTRDANNIIVYAQDSKLMKFPQGTSLCFSFIDGNHDPEYVASDFDLAWNATVPGGIVAFHDYDPDGGGVLPQVTITVNRLIELNGTHIQDTFNIRETGMILLRKREGWPAGAGKPTTPAAYGDKTDTGFNQVTVLLRASK